MPGGFTPNGSVKWFVEADTKDSEVPQGSKIRLEGRDEIDKDHFFQITIRYPKNSTNRTKFQALLTAAGQNGTDEALTLTMPIEDQGSGYTIPSPADPANYDPEVAAHWHIYVDWPVKLSDAEAGSWHLPSRVPNR